MMSVKQKILFVAPNLHHGGAEGVLIKLLNNIDLERYIVKLILIKKEGEHLSKLSKEIEIINLGHSKSIFAIPKLKKVIKNEKPDYVFSIIGQINLILAALKLLFFKDTYFIGRENVVYSEWLYKNKTVKKQIFSIMYKLLLRKLDTVVVQSSFMANQVHEYFTVPRKKIVILNNPIERDKIKTFGQEHDLGNKWNYDKINLIAVGRIEAVKNYHEMVDIIEMLPNIFHLNILGDGKERSCLEEYISNKKLNEKITLHGFVINPYKYMKESFALLLTSTRESFPNVVLEANACGIYVVSYDMPGGISEIITNNLNGSLITQGNKNEFVDKLLELNKRGYNSEVIIEYINKYSIEGYMDSIYGLFQKKSKNT